MQVCKIFESEMRVAWEEIKRAVIKTRNILNTRAYFAKRWIRNAVRFCLFSRYNAYVLKGQSPVIVCASGPSLKRSPAHDHPAHWRKADSRRPKARCPPIAL